MPPLRRLLALLAVLALLAPAGAAAQDGGAILAQGEGLSGESPVPLDGGEDPADDGADEPAGAGDEDSAAPRDELPDTGADAVVVFLGGVCLLLIGTGLRLRTADASVY